jgi:16S rRNA (guanine527-N7)-methyltransferase
MQEKLKQFEALVIKWNAAYNLVAKSTIDSVYDIHIANCLPLINHIKKDAIIVDFGSGAGFPSVILAIAGYKITAVESVGKKTLFLKEVKRQLGLDNLTIVCDRIENCIFPDATLITARAFADLKLILDYAKIIKVKNLCLLKGERIEDEIIEAKKHHNFDYTLTANSDGYIVDITTSHNH